MPQNRTMDLRDRVVLITGAARGIGLDAARRAAARGARVALLDVDAPALAQQAEALGDGAAAFPVDVTDRDALDEAVEAVVARFGGLDAVVANAGVAPPPGTILSIDADAFDRVLEINLTGVYRTVKATLPHVIARRGHVLVVASVYAFANGALASPYAVSKAAVEQLGRALRVELAPHGATAGVAYFGFIDTDMVRDTFRDRVSAEAREAMPGFIRRPLPVGRAGSAIVRGLERRSARVMVPRYVPVASVLRGLLALGMDPGMTREPRLTRAILAADAEQSAAPAAEETAVSSAGPRELGPVDDVSLDAR